MTTHVEDPHFEEVANETKDIQTTVDSLLFRSVFHRIPQGVSPDDVPPIPESVPDFGELTLTIDKTLARIAELEDRLKALESDNTTFGDQIEEYLRDIEESEKSLRSLKKIIKPEMLSTGESGKTDVSWLSLERNTLNSKLHTEINEVQNILDESSGSEADYDSLLKRLEQHRRDAEMLDECAQYLAWFTKQVVQRNESLKEYERDFTVGLVAQWINEEVAKVAQHLSNCANVKTEIEEKKSK
ncbi:hypothetical protein AAVH_15228 [Aphelenchoides avenae]|nr:hypothetical protein AAVH_15228 [Aphelenchus avenae]